MGREGDPLDYMLGIDVLGGDSLTGCSVLKSSKHLFIKAGSPELSVGGVHIRPFVPPVVRRRVG